MFKHNIVSAFFQYNLLEDHLFWNFLCSSSLFKIYFLIFICDISHHLSYYIYIFFLHGLLYRIHQLQIFSSFPVWCLLRPRYNLFPRNIHMIFYNFPFTFSQDFLMIPAYACANLYKTFTFALF